MLTPDSPENYNAYKGRQRQQNEKRQQFQAVTRLGGDTSSPISDAQLSDHVAKLTGSALAPEDMVKANRDLFREAADNAWADEIGGRAPITLAMAGDPKATPLPKDDYNHLASVEQAAGNLVAASKAIPDGTPWAGGWLNWPSIPNPELADEFAGVRQKDERKTVPSVWDNPSEMPEAAQDGTMLNGGWADSPSIPRTDSRPSGDLTADAAAIRQQVDQQSDGNPAPSGGQSHDNGLPDEKVSLPDGVVSEPGAPAPSQLGGTEVGSASRGDRPAPPADSGPTTVSMGGDTVEEDRFGLRPGEGVILVELTPGSGSPARTSPAGDMMPEGNQPGPPHQLSEPNSRESANAASGAAPALLATTGNAEPIVAGTSKSTNSGSGYWTSYGAVPTSPAEKKGWAPSYENGLEERAGFVDRILNAKGMTTREVALLRRDLLHQKFISPSWAEHVLTQLLTGKKDEAWVREALLPHTLNREVTEVVRAVPGGALNSVGHATEATGQLLHATESAERETLVDDIANAKGKNADEIAALRRRISDQHDINPTDAQRFLSEVVAGDMAPDEARQALSPMLKEVSETLKTAGAGLQDYSKTVLPAPPDMKDSWGRGLGEAIGGAIPGVVIGAATGPWAAWLYGALDVAGTQSSKAREAKADPEMQAKAALLGLPLGLITNAPIADEVTKLPWLQKYADSWVDSVVVKPITSGVLGAGQEFGSNVIAQQTYDSGRNWWDGVASAFATGAVVSGVEPGLKRAARLAITPVRRAIELHGMLNEMGDRLKAVPATADGSKTAHAIIEQRLKGTPAENVYFRADTFVDSLKNAGIDPWKFTLGLGGATLADLRAAVDAKGYIRIPTATFAVDLMGTKAGNALKPSLSFEAGGVTAADIEALTPAFKTPGALVGPFGTTANTPRTPLLN